MLDAASYFCKNEFNKNFNLPFTRYEWLFYEFTTWFCPKVSSLLIFHVQRSNSKSKTMDHVPTPRLDRKGENS